MGVNVNPLAGIVRLPLTAIRLPTPGLDTLAPGVPSTKFIAAPGVKARLPSAPLTAVPKVRVPIVPPLDVEPTPGESEPLEPTVVAPLPAALTMAPTPLTFWLADAPNVMPPPLSPELSSAP